MIRHIGVHRIGLDRSHEVVDIVDKVRTNSESKIQVVFKLPLFRHQQQIDISIDNFPMFPCNANFQLCERLGAGHMAMMAKVSKSGTDGQ